MLSFRFIIASSLLVANAAHAAEPLACLNSLDLGLDKEVPIALAGDGETIELTTGAFEATFGPNPTAIVTGGVLLRRGQQLAGADTARYDPQDRALHLQGNVRYEAPQTEIESDTAVMSYDSGLVQFTGAEFYLNADNSRGAADNILITEQGKIELDDVSYTTCPPGSNDWELEAGAIDLDTRKGSGTARNVKLKFQNIPILYSPYLSFPVGDARKTGLLTPEIGSSGRSGTEIKVPYYLNLAPNYDATITLRQLTDRGVHLGTDFRYLTSRHDGSLAAQYLPDDDLVDGSREMFAVKHRTRFENGWRGLVDMRDVSDGQYFEDLGGSLSVSSTTHLNRSVTFDWHSDTMSFFGRVQDYQTLDDAILPVEEPYQRLPQILFRGHWPDRFMGLTAGIDAELVNFNRNVGVTGWRTSIAPKLELPTRGNGWFVDPAVEWNVTRYELSDTNPGEATDPTRTLPIASLDAGLVFERLLNGSSGNRRLQTIEPRVLYVHIPFRDQDDLPIFDTIMPDLNLVQLFRKNRFLGYDRIGDTDQYSVGITSRILDLESGKELVTASIGQTRYLSDRVVGLGNTGPADFNSSDYIAEVRFLLYENINFDIGHQWSAGDDGTTQSQARFQYRPSSNKILNMAYRFRRDSIEQGDLSWSWPLASQWNFVGRYNYSIRDNEVLEQFFGLEYESCCWGLRLVSRKHISTRDGTRDSSFGLQLVLKGMTAVGTAADKLLERGILGYSADLR